MTLNEFLGQKDVSFVIFKIMQFYSQKHTKLCHGNTLRTTYFT